MKGETPNKIIKEIIKMKEIYTREEELMVNIAKALTAKENTTKALELDLMLLEMESELNIVDGVRYE